MKIPTAMLSLLNSGELQFTEDARDRLKLILRPQSLRGGFLPRLYSITEIRQVNPLRLAGSLSWLRGNELPGIEPGIIDPSQAIVFGHIEPDSPLALDQRSSPGEVIYLSDVGSQLAWIGLSVSFEKFVEQIFGTRIRNSR